MTENKDCIELKCDTYWFKVVDKPKTNWALIDEQLNGSALVWIVDDNSCVVDEMTFPTLRDAVFELMDNGFDLYARNEHARRNLSKPLPPFHRVQRARSCSD